MVIAMPSAVDRHPLRGERRGVAFEDRRDRRQPSDPLHPTQPLGAPRAPAAARLASDVRSPAAVLALQRAAGNAAVVRALEQPESRVVARDGPPATAEPDTVARPTRTELETIAQGYIGDYNSAASGGLTDFETTMADDVDWGPFWLGVMGNLLWATACFVTGPAGEAAATAGKQFLVSTSGIGVAAAGAGLSVGSRSEFHTALVEKHLDAVTKELNDQVKEVAGSVDADAAAGSWGDNRTRLELVHRLMKPQYAMVARGGLPNVDQAAIRRLVQRTLIIQANEVGIGARNVAFAGEVIYYYDVTGAEDTGTWYERSTVAPTRNWNFKLRKVAVRLETGGNAAVKQLMRSGRLQPSKLRMNKRLSITAVGSGIIWDDGFAIMLDDRNKVWFVGESKGIFDDMWEGSPGAKVYAEHAVARAWASTGGLPPDVDEFETFDSYW
jgi:hypothetical protein